MPVKQVTDRENTKVQMPQNIYTNILHIDIMMYLQKRQFLSSICRSVQQAFQKHYCIYCLNNLTTLQFNNILPCIAFNLLLLHSDVLIAWCQMQCRRLPTYKENTDRIAYTITQEKSMNKHLVAKYCNFCTYLLKINCNYQIS